MANEISIRLSSFSDFTAVNVEGLGVIKVKQESSNQGARHSEIIRDIFKLQDKVKKMQDEQNTLIVDGKISDQKKFDALETESTDMLDKIASLRKEDQQLRKSRLSDDHGGKLVDKLFEHANDADISRLLAMDGIKEVEKDEPDTAS